MAKIQIIVGSVMGTAVEVANTLSTILNQSGHTCRINPNFSPADLADPDEILLICTSNTGMGDLPGNIVPFYLHLTQDFPNIAGRKFGLVNLGDSSYPNFAQAGKTLEAALTDIGAQLLGDALILDAILVDDYAEEARTWLEQWAPLLPA